MEKQLTILSESLERKEEILKALLAYSKKQELELNQTEPDVAAFDLLVDQKDQLIDQLTHLDEGFEAMYEKLSDGLKQNKDQYASQIRELKNKIEKVTALGTLIQKQEAINKKLIDDYFAKQKNNLRKNRTNARAAYDYYKSMSGINSATSSFMDSKHNKE